jgi:hypothetical protein
MLHLVEACAKGQTLAIERFIDSNLHFLADRDIIDKRRLNVRCSDYDEFGPEYDPAGLAA